MHTYWCIFALFGVSCIRVSNTSINTHVLIPAWKFPEVGPVGTLEPQLEGQVVYPLVRRQ